MVVTAVVVLAVGLLCSAWTWVAAVQLWRMPPGPERERLTSRYWRLRLVGIALALAGVVAFWLAVGSG